MKEWTKSEITQKVCELAASEANVPVTDVKPDTQFIDDLNYDSLTMVELVMKVEDGFDIRIPDPPGDAQATFPKSVAEFATVVELKLREGTREIP